MVDFGFEHVGAGRSERLDHVFISTYREQTHRINKADYGSEMWLHGMVLLNSKPSACTGLILLRAVLVPPGLSYKPITSASRDCGNISHDPTHDSSRDPSVTRTSCDLSARDPGNIRPHDPGKITHDLSRNWSSTMSPDQTCFGCASNLLINTWQIVGTINKTCPLTNQLTRNATRPMKT